MNKKYMLALFYSLILHVSILLLVTLSDFTSTPKPTAQALAQQAKAVKPIKAVAINKKNFEAQVNRIRRKKAANKAAENRRIKRLENRAARAKKSRRKEQQRIKKLERARKVKEQEAKKANKKANIANARAAAADEDIKKKEALKRRADKAANDAVKRRIKEEKAAKKSEDLRKRILVARQRKQKAAQEKAAQERQLAKQLAQEMANRQNARRKQMMTEIQRYTALIVQSIQQNLIKDRSTMAGKSCKLTISLAPSGFVTNVVQNGGDRIVCDAAQQAIYKAGTLPVSKDPDVFKEMRTVSILFAPSFDD